MEKFFVHMQNNVVELREVMLNNITTITFMTVGILLHFCFSRIVSYLTEDVKRQPEPPLSLHAARLLWTMEQRPHIWSRYFKHGVVYKDVDGTPLIEIHEENKRLTIWCNCKLVTDRFTKYELTQLSKALKQLLAYISREEELAIDNAVANTISQIYTDSVRQDVEAELAPSSDACCTEDVKKCAPSSDDKCCTEESKKYWEQFANMRMDGDTSTHDVESSANLLEIMRKKYLRKTPQNISDKLMD